jgi:hypothetical protein
MSDEQSRFKEDLAVFEDLPEPVQGGIAGIFHALVTDAAAFLGIRKTPPDPPPPEPPVRVNRRKAR